MILNILLLVDNQAWEKREASKYWSMRLKQVYPWNSGIAGEVFSRKIVLLTFFFTILLTLNYLFRMIKIHLLLSLGRQPVAIHIHLSYFEMHDWYWRSSWRIIHDLLKISTINKDRALAKSLFRGGAVVAYDIRQYRIGPFVATNGFLSTLKDITVALTLISFCFDTVKF